MQSEKRIAIARGLRERANYPERIAWETLRSLRTHGFPVRRQHPVGPFVVDFAITRARLVIEIDGAIHGLHEVAARDAARQEKIQSLGWRVLRIASDIATSPVHLMALVCKEIGL